MNSMGRLSAQAAASTESAEISGWILWPTYLQWQPPGFDLWPSANHSVRQVSLQEREDCCYVLSNQRKHVSERWFQVSQGSLVLVSRQCRSDDHKIWQSPGFWGRQIICHEESDYHTWTASYMHVVLLICLIWFFCICTFVGEKKSFDDHIWSFVVRDTGPSSQRDRLLQVASSWSPVGLLQSLTTSRPWSGVRLCCCLHQRLWEQWVIGVLSADWRRSVSALTVRPPAPVLCDSLCLPHHSFVWWLGFPLEPGK